MNSEFSNAMIQKSLDTTTESVDSILNNVLYWCAVGYFPAQLEDLTNQPPVEPISPNGSPLLQQQQFDGHAYEHLHSHSHSHPSCEPAAVKLSPTMPPSPLSMPASPLTMNTACISLPMIKPIAAGVLPSPQSSLCMEQHCYSIEHLAPQSLEMQPSLSFDTTISSASSSCDYDTPKFSVQHRCLWDGCGREFDVQTDLLRHLSEDHVGRSLRGNLCLTCRWPGCSRVAKKRDHMVSHLKSHVPFWPFTCKYCGNRFKHATGLNRHINRHEMRGETQ